MKAHIPPCFMCILRAGLRSSGALPVSPNYLQKGSPGQLFQVEFQCGLKGRNCSLELKRQKQNTFHSNPKNLTMPQSIHGGSGGQRRPCLIDPRPQSKWQSKAYTLTYHSAEQGQPRAPLGLHLDLWQSTQQTFSPPPLRSKRNANFSNSFIYLGPRIPAPEAQTPVRKAELCIASGMSLKGWEWSEGTRSSGKKSETPVSHPDP